MKLAEALKIAQATPQPGAAPLRVFLACGFQPLHLETFLLAHLRILFPDKKVEVLTGAYGDMTGNLVRLHESRAGSGAVAFEWSDFDPRLGLRSLAEWSPDVVPDILATVGSRAREFTRLLQVASDSASLVITLPTLPPPPVGASPPSLAGSLELGLAEAAAAFGLQTARLPRARLVSRDRLDHRSPPGGRLDVKSELLSGFPYTTAHADAVASLLAEHVRGAPPKKGLITDLDDTLWRGLLGEDGIEHVSWDLDRHSHMHAVYQRLLHALSKAGVLVGVASRNDPDLVAEALKREDLLLPADRVFPVVVNWGRKSLSVEQVLKKWNLGADSVVFVDDTALELAEVQDRFPEITCLLYPTRDDQAVHGLLERLRDLFGKAAIGEEDLIRLESLRRADTARVELRAGDGGADEFLAAAEAKLTIRAPCDPADPRPFDLVNKTNQFNLNGRRFTSDEWRQALARTGSVSCAVAYGDKYGPLGTIAVMLGTAKSKTLELDAWVMSCRAFGRRIEHACLRLLFDRFGFEEVVLDFRGTDRNGPLRDFLATCAGSAPTSTVRIGARAFRDACPDLRHRIEGLPDV